MCSMFNGMATRASMEMLQNSLRRQEIDIIFLQEIAYPTLNELRNYKSYTNMGAAMRGTVLVTREEIVITNITKLPPGRGIAAEFRGIRMIKIYARPEQQERRENNSSIVNSPIC